MTTGPDQWVYGEHTPDPASRDLIGLKANWIVRSLPDTVNPAVLDFGAGEGKYLRLVRSVRPGARLTGVDVRAPSSAVDFDFHLISGDSDLPFSAETFDLVISCDVLEHVVSVGHTLDEIARVLRGGGLFIGFVPLEGGLGPHRLFRWFDPNIYRDTKDHRHAYTGREMRRLLTDRMQRVAFAYSYHLLGGLLDAAFFASFKMPGIGQRMESFWRGQENLVYRKQAATDKPSMLSRLTQWANTSAYWESTALSSVSFGASGLHFCLRKATADAALSPRGP